MFNRPKQGDIVRSKRNRVPLYRVLKVYGLFKQKVDVQDINDVFCVYRGCKKSLFYKV